jgi:hypothetical protein
MEMLDFGSGGGLPGLNRKIIVLKLIAQCTIVHVSVCDKVDCCDSRLLLFRNNESGQTGRTEDNNHPHNARKKTPGPFSIGRKIGVLLFLLLRLPAGFYVLRLFL